MGIRSLLPRPLDRLAVTFFPELVVAAERRHTSETQLADRSISAYQSQSATPPMWRLVSLWRAETTTAFDFNIMSH